MTSASTLRLQIESSLAQKIPSALSPVAKMIRPVAATGITSVDEVLYGGLPVGALSELVGPECSGRTSLALSFVACITQAAKVCAWIDVSNVFSPISAASTGVDLARLLWVRCGASSAAAPRQESHSMLPAKYMVPSAVKQGLHGGGCGGHPRGEVKGLSEAVSGFLRAEAIEPRCAEPQQRVGERQENFAPAYQAICPALASSRRNSTPWSRMEQAIRVTDQLLQGGGFSAIVLDMGSLTPEFVSRIPLATWFRYRAAAERTQSSILLLTQHSCAKSSAELLLRLLSGEPLCEETTVFCGLDYRVEVARRQFASPSNVVSMRRPPQSARAGCWRGRTAWAGQR
jgi:recombination protein RecA